MPQRIFKTMNQAKGKLLNRGDTVKILGTELGAIPRRFYAIGSAQAYIFDPFGELGDTQAENDLHVANWRVLDNVGQDNKGLAETVREMLAARSVLEARLAALEAIDHTHVEVIDALNSTSSVAALSAAQGNALEIGTAALATQTSASVAAIRARLDTLEAIDHDHVAVTDALTSTSADDALSAYQGKVLDEKIAAAASSSSTALSAAAARLAALEAIDHDHITVTDNLTGTSAVNALSENQGKVLDDKITAVVNSANASNTSSNTRLGALESLDHTHVIVTDNLTGTSAVNALSENQGKVLDDKITANAAAGGVYATRLAALETLDHTHVTVADNLTSTSSVDALSAGMGNGLDVRITALENVAPPAAGGTLLFRTVVGGLIPSNVDDQVFTRARIDLRDAAGETRVSLKPGGGSNVAVFGKSDSSQGGQFRSGTGTGIYGYSQSGAGISIQSVTGIGGVTQTASGPYGMITYANDLGLYLIAARALGNYGFYTNGNGYVAGTITQGSDERLKKNIVDLDPAATLAAVRSISGVRFEWDAENNPERAYDEGVQLGVIAQRVREQFPELVFEVADNILEDQSDPDSAVAEIKVRYSVNYTGFIAPLITSVGALADQYDTLLASNKNLHNTVTALTKQLAALQKAVNLLTSKP